MNKEKLFITKQATIKEGLKALDFSAEKVLLVVEENDILIGTLTDGDIRRHLLKGGNLDDSIKGVYNSSPIYVTESDTRTIQTTLITNKIDLVPVLDETQRVVNVFNWGDVFSEKKEKQKRGSALEIPAVIMAGGKGTRLKPFTTVLPKPLIPIADKTILELVMNNFIEYGIKEFYFTVNYRGEMIKAYFDSLDSLYKISYVWEKNYNGTAGSLSLIDSLNTPFLVSNCDIIVKADYTAIYNFHKKNNACLTIVSSIQHHTVPYGVVEYTEGGSVTKINEKPEFSFPINTGVYILEPKALNFIPKNSFFHMTHLIEALIDAGEKVVTYIVNEKDYIDIGQWEEYRSVVRELKDIE